jgi:hypothetical protein
LAARGFLEKTLGLGMIGESVADARLLRQKHSPRVLRRHNEVRQHLALGWEWIIAARQKSSAKINGSIDASI